MSDATGGTTMAAMAGRLADLIAASDAGGPAQARTVAFLRAMAARGGGVPDRLPAFVARLGGTALEAELLLLAGLAEEHEGYAAVFRSVSPRGEPRPTVGLAAQLLCGGDPESVARLREAVECGALVRSGALLVPAEAPCFERPLVPADGLWSALHGVDAWPPVLERFAAPVVRAGLEEWLAAPPARRALAALRDGSEAVVLLTADHADAAAERALVLAGAAGLPALAVRLDVGDAAAVRLAAVHALARGAALVLVPADLAEGSVPRAPVLPAVGPCLLCAGAGLPAPRTGRPILAVPCDRLPALARRRAWAALVPELGREAATLAARFTLEPAAVAAAAADARGAARLEGRALELPDLVASVRVRGAMALPAGVAQRHPAAGWDDLVLPADRVAQLREAVSRLRHQATVLDEWRFLDGRAGARGVRMLFAGPPGTGKTLAAEVMAHALGVDLLVVDLARVVSKWIGETEKNLARAFDAAERAQAVLLFDEADALFGRRTDVSDAHDRYANLETAYLLSRLERFEGLAVLSTNLKHQIDPAFLRRLEFVVEFEEPGVAEREALWRCHLPATAPLAPDVELGELAALYPVVGGLIRNAAVGAAFLAAADRSPITRTHFVQALRREYDKAARAFPGVPAGVALS